MGSLRALYLFSCALACAAYTGTAPPVARARVRDLDAESLQYAVTRHRRLVVLMHDGSDAVSRAFQPWLYAIANLVPHVPIGRVDLSRDGGAEVAAAFQVPADRMPFVKLFVRDAPKGKKVVDYLGPLDFESVLSWVRAAMDDDPHELSAYGVEPEGADEFAPEGGPGGGATAGAMGRLPESVRAMAQTMVRETRLQRILKQMGDGRVEHYDAMVRQRYNEIVSSEETNMGNKFAVQEANRRARDLVREELMESAPAHVREEIEAEVALGDAAKGANANGDVTMTPDKAKKPKKKKKKDKEEL